jgi:hypothetical protein
VELAQSGETNDSRLHVLRAEADVRLAEDSLKRAEATNKRLANTISPGEMARLVAARDLARLKVERARQLASEPPLSHLRFDVDELREDVQEIQLSEMMSRRGS